MEHVVYHYKLASHNNGDSCAGNWRTNCPVRLLIKIQSRFSALGVVEKAVLATAAALGFVLFVFLLIPTGPTPTYVIAAPPPAA